MEFETFAAKILSLKKADEDLRNALVQNGTLSEGYNQEMEALHINNAEQLNEIIDAIGYPTIKKVGKKASAAAWLIIQHAISKPDFMRKSLHMLSKAVSEKDADSKHLAYLTDRIAVLEGKPQLYGTQFDWDGAGNLMPNPYDDLSEVNQRRKALDLNTLEEQTEIIQLRAQQENESPPLNFYDRKKRMEKWRLAVGWKIKNIMMHKVNTHWTSKMAFDSHVDKHIVKMDASEPLGDDSGASPKKLLLSSLAGCTGIDVVSLLEKMRVSYSAFEIEVEADLTSEHPKVYSEIRLTYRFTGEDIDREKVEKAVALSKDKYCGVSAMLKKNCPIIYTIEYVLE